VVSEALSAIQVYNRGSSVAIEVGSPVGTVLFPQGIHDGFHVTDLVPSINGLKHFFVVGFASQMIPTKKGYGMSEYLQGTILPVRI